MSILRYSKICIRNNKPICHYKYKTSNNILQPILSTLQIINQMKMTFYISVGQKLLVNIKFWFKTIKRTGYLSWVMVFHVFSRSTNNVLFIPRRWWLTTWWWCCIPSSWRKWDSHDCSNQMLLCFLSLCSLIFSLN